MKGTTNMTKVREAGKPIPMNEYCFQITDKTDKYSKNGDPMVNIVLTVVKGEEVGAVVYDNILIPALDSPAAKILGRTKHFLHCIGEPYEGEEVVWDSDVWLGKTLKAMIGHEDPNEFHKNTRAVVQEYTLDEQGEAKAAIEQNVAEAGEEAPF